MYSKGVSSGKERLPCRPTFFIFYLYHDVIVLSRYMWSSYSMLEAFYVMHVSIAGSRLPLYKGYNMPFHS